MALISVKASRRTNQLWSVLQLDAADAFLDNTSFAQSTPQKHPMVSHLRKPALVTETNSVPTTKSPMRVARMTIRNLSEDLDPNFAPVRKRTELQSTFTSVAVPWHHDFAGLCGHCAHAQLAARVGVAMSQPAKLVVLVGWALEFVRATSCYTRNVEVFGGTPHSKPVSYRVPSPLGLPNVRQLAGSSLDDDYTPMDHISDNAGPSSVIDRPSTSSRETAFPRSPYPKGSLS